MGYIQYPYLKMDMDGWMEWWLCQTASSVIGIRGQKMNVASQMIAAGVKEHDEANKMLDSLKSGLDAI